LQTERDDSRREFKERIASLKGKVLLAVDAVAKLADIFLD
jgi:hypothetical protein